MRHRKNKLLLLRGSVQRRDLLMRTMLTNLIRYGHLTTTEKKSKVLIAYANNFFAKLVSLAVSRLSPDADRERVRFVKSVVFGNEEGKKVILELLPLFASNNATTNFLTHVKLGRRIGDAAETVRIEFM